MSTNTGYGALHETSQSRPPAVDARRFHKVGDHIELPQEAAEAHPLYGIAGWTVVLAVFMVLDAVFAALVIIATFVVAMRGAGGFYMVLGLVHLGILCWAIACLVKLFSKKPDFPSQYTALCIVSAVFTVIGGLIGGFSWVLAAQLAVIAIYLAYVQRSRRIRVTFRHQVESGDAYLGKLFPEGLPDHLKPAVSPWSAIGKMPAPSGSGIAAARRPF